MENPEHPINGVYTNYHNSLSGVKVVSDYNIHLKCRIEW